MRVEGNILYKGTIAPRAMEIENGIIKSVYYIDDRENLKTILPGFFDIHTHGGNRLDVNHIESYEDVNNLSLFFAKQGVTNFLLSVMTDDIAKMDSIVKILANAMERGTDGARLAGIHLEGPFLSLEYKGAMPEELIREGDIDLFNHFQEISRNNIRYITLAPERPGMLDMISKIKAEGRCVIAMGHSSAEYEEAVEAIKRGVTASTHTFNAMKLFHMHRPAISGAALESDDVYCEIIADGFHLHQATVRLILKTKGWDKVVAITDSIMAAGLPDGEYMLGVNEVVVAGGDAKLKNGVRAGSTLTMQKVLKNLKCFTGASLDKISRIMATNQAALLNINDTGTLDIGKRADFVVIDDDLNVLETVVKGKTVYKKEEK